MKRVLMIAYYFPPVAATGAMRPLNFCRHLPVYGWMPSVVATDHASALPPQAADELLLKRIPSGTGIMRVPHANILGRLLGVRDRFKRTLKRKSTVSPRLPMGRVGVLKKRDKRQESALEAGGRFVIDALLSFPDPQCQWYRPAVRAMLTQNVGERPDVIWATGGPWTSLLVGRNLAQRWGLPFVADFRDPWVGGHGLFSSSLLNRRAARLERAVCEAASRVVLNTQELCVRFSSEYPQWKHKFLVITNGYAEELAPNQQAGNGADRGAASRRAVPLELCHFGTVYGNRSPIALFSSIQELITEGVLDPTLLTLRFVGAWDVDDPACNQLAKSLEEQGVLKRTPPIPHQKCLKEMAESDVLLILQPNYPLQVPAKIYEYIVAGRPLFVLGGEGATANLVQRHRLGRCCPNRVQEIKHTLNELMKDRTSLAAPNPSDTSQFSYRFLSKCLAEIFNDVVNGRSL